MADTDSLPKNPERLEIEELTALQPGLARFMPEIGTRFWKCCFAARAENWPMAVWQLKELRKLMHLCKVTRPKYADDLDEFIHDDLHPLMEALEAEDLPRFERLFHDATDAANAYPRRWKKPWIVWKLPEMPPPDLDLTPRA
jgi:hypothetical protein